MVGDSFAYGKDAIIGKWKQWLLLLVATILLTIPLLGYSLKALRGEKPAPEVTGWGTLIIDGIKYFIVSLIWAIPCLIILFFGLGSLIAAIATQGMNPEVALAFISGAVTYLILFLIVAIVTGLLATIGIVRFARTGSMGEAFNFGAIIETIGKIGWGSYIIALIIIGIILAIIEVVCMAIPYVGQFIFFLILPMITLWHARYICLIYDSAGAT